MREARQVHFRHEQTAVETPFGQQRAVLRDKLMGAIDAVGDGFARARARVEVAAGQAQGLARDELPVTVVHADNGGGGVETADNRRAVAGHGRRRRYGRGQVAAELKA